MCWICACNVDVDVPSSDLPPCSRSAVERRRGDTGPEWDLLICGALTLTTDQVTPQPVADLLHLDTVFTLPITSDVLETFPVGRFMTFMTICSSTEFGCHLRHKHALIQPFDDPPESIFLSIWSICHCLFSPLLAALRHPLHHYQQIEWWHEVRLRIDNNINGNHIISRAMRTAAQPRWGSARRRREYVSVMKYAHFAHPWRINVSTINFKTSRYLSSTASIQAAI